MAMVDKEGAYILANRNYANRFGFEPCELVSLSRKQVLSVHIFEKHRQMFQQALGGESISYLEEVKLPDGTTMSANGKYEPQFNNKGKVESITICVDDVSELIHTQKALKEANATKDRLFSIIAHDIKNPLNLFQGLLSLKNNDSITNEEFNDYQEVVQSRLSGLVKTVDELLEWSRMQLGGINAYPSKVNVNSVVKENVDLFEALIKRKSLVFDVETSPDLEVWIDLNHFKVALRNLIHNAIKFTSKGGTVKVIGSQNDSEAIISVVDSGIGMSAERIDSVIRKEIQKSKAGTDKEMGTGLGLSLSLGLLEKNNCKVSITSQAGKGTKVEIKIPNQ